jgi:hypothetical protein
MSRFTFDVYIRKEQFILLPVNLICRKRNGEIAQAEKGEQYLLTLEASSYENAAEVLMDKIRQVK